MVLYYENGEEKTEFEEYVESSQEVIESYINEADKRYFEINTDNVLEVKACIHRLSTGLALNKALSEFRKA